MILVKTPENSRWQSFGKLQVDFWEIFRKTGVLSEHFEIFFTKLRHKIFQANFRKILTNVLKRVSFGIKYAVYVLEWLMPL